MISWVLLLALLLVKKSPLLEYPYTTGPTLGRPGLLFAYITQKDKIYYHNFEDLKDLKTQKQQN